MKHTDQQTVEYFAKKGSDRIQINNILCAVCVGALSVLLGLSSEKLSSWAVAQLGVAIPCLVTSSLAYAKCGYRDLDESKKWDQLGWFTHTIGYAVILNAIGIMLYRNKFILVTWMFISVVVMLFLIYSILDIILKKYRMGEKILKLSFYLILLFAGLVAPIIGGWV